MRLLVVLATAAFLLSVVAMHAHMVEMGAAEVQATAVAATYLLGLLFGTGAA